MSRLLVVALSLVLAAHAGLGIYVLGPLAGRFREALTGGDLDEARQINARTKACLRASYVTGGVSGALLLALLVTA